MSKFLGHQMDKLAQFFTDSKERIITAAALILAFSLIAFIDSYFLVWLILGAVFIVGFYEACKLFDVNKKELYVLALVLWLLAGIFPSNLLINAVVILGLISFMLYKNELDFKLLSPFFYPSIPMLLLLSLYEDFGMYAIIWLVIIVAGTDTFAYVVGKFIGKTKFSSISPNKTIEGVLGGVGIATLVGTIFGLFGYSFFTALLVSLLTSFFSVWGDLFESYLKRQADVKDSGNIFPGHGGILDRMDGYLFGVVFMLVLLKWFA